MHSPHINIYKFREQSDIKKNHCHMAYNSSHLKECHSDLLLCNKIQDEVLFQKNNFHGVISDSNPP